MVRVPNISHPVTLDVELAKEVSLRLAKRGQMRQKHQNASEEVKFDVTHPLPFSVALWSGKSGSVLEIVLNQGLAIDTSGCFHIHLSAPLLTTRPWP